MHEVLSWFKHDWNNGQRWHWLWHNKLKTYAISTNRNNQHCAHSPLPTLNKNIWMRQMWEERQQRNRTLAGNLSGLYAFVLAISSNALATFVGKMWTNRRIVTIGYLIDESRHLKFVKNILHNIHENIQMRKSKHRKNNECESVRGLTCIFDKHCINYEKD